jgi:hypothetical protein
MPVELRRLVDPLSTSQIQEWTWSRRLMILTWESWWVWRKTCPSTTLSTTGHTWTICALTWVADNRFLGTSQVTNPVSLAYFCLTLLQWYEATVSSISWLEVDWNRMSIVEWPWCDVTSGARTERKCTGDANPVPTVGRWLICCLYRTLRHLAV